MYNKDLEKKNSSEVMDLEMLSNSIREEGFLKIIFFCF